MKYETTARSEGMPTPTKLPVTANKGKSKPNNNHKLGFPPDQDIVLWLAKNAPSNFDELIDIRYSLYHRCNGGGYRVRRINDEELRIAGRNGSLHIVSNQARRLLLTKLRELAKEKGWQGALPKICPRKASASSLARHPSTKN
ncbi:hypothetical protein [Bradyrhizobium guangdongense]